MLTSHKYNPFILILHSLLHHMTYDECSGLDLGCNIIRTSARVYSITDDSLEEAYTFHRQCSG